MYLFKFNCFFLVLLAVAIPKLDLFISLVGALCLSLLGVALPALIECLVFVKTKSGLPRLNMIGKNSLFIIFGLFALVIGTITPALEIFNSFNDNNQQNEQPLKC